MFCGQCGIQVPDNYKFCPGCGKELIPQTSSTESTKLNASSAPKPKKSKAKKVVKGIGISIGVFFALIIIVGVIASTTNHSTNSSTNQSIDQAKIDNANKITGVTNFLILKEGSLYQARFSLVDANNDQMASDANVTVQVKRDDGSLVYSQNFTVSQDDFKTYQLQLTGTQFLAYAWQIDASNLQHSDLEVLKGYLTVTLPNGKTYSTDTSVF
jgi:hypothetical protein